MRFLPNCSHLPSLLLSFLLPSLLLSYKVALLSSLSYSSSSFYLSSLLFCPPLPGPSFCLAGGLMLLSLALPVGHRVQQLGEHSECPVEMLVFPVRYPVRVPVAYPQPPQIGMVWASGPGLRRSQAMFSLGPPHVRQEEVPQCLLHSNPLILGSWPVPCLCPSVTLDQCLYCSEPAFPVWKALSCICCRCAGPASSSCLVYSRTVSASVPSLWDIQAARLSSFFLLIPA